MCLPFAPGGNDLWHDAHKVRPHNTHPHGSRWSFGYEINNTDRESTHDTSPQDYLLGAPPQPSQLSAATSAVSPLVTFVQVVTRLTPVFPIVFSILSARNSSFASDRFILVRLTCPIYDALPIGL
jgi:hypothetical protein